MNRFNTSLLSIGLLLLMLTADIPVLAQDSTFSANSHPKHLTYEKGGGGLLVKQGKRQLNQNELYDVLNEDHDAARYVGRYKTKNTAGAILGGIGGGLIGWPLGQAVGGGDPQWAVALAGVGVLAIAIPIAISATKEIKTGIDVYNDNLVSRAYVPRPMLKFGGQANGVGLALKF